jgi:hypothetical protein
VLVEAKRKNVSRLFEKAQSYVKLRLHRGREVDGPSQSAILLVRESLVSVDAHSHVFVDEDALSLIHDLANRWDRTTMSLTSRLVLVHLVASYIAGIGFLVVDVGHCLLAPLAVLVAVPMCLWGLCWQFSGHRFDYYDGYAYWFAYILSRQYVFALLPAYGFLQSYRYSEMRPWPVVATACVVFILPFIDYYFRF